MLKISACVITKNEASNIARCLQSVKDFVNEMVVVDTGSTDETQQIAKSMGAKLFFYQWRNDFAAARNYALQQAKGDWIVFLDADEYFGDGTGANIRPFLEKVHPSATVESVTCRMEHTEGVDGPFKGCNPAVRIFRNSPAIRYRGGVHECIYKNGKPTKTITDTGQALLIRHTGYTRETIVAKLKRNTQMLEEGLANGVMHDLAYHYLSDGYRKLGEYEKAIHFARKALEHEAGRRRGTVMIAYKPYVALLVGMTRLGTYREADITVVLDEAARRFPDHPEILGQAAFCAMAFGHYQTALTQFLKAVAANDQYNDLTLENEFPGQLSLIFQNIALLYEWQNQPVNALNYYVKALKHHQYNQAAFQGLIALIRKQKPAEIVYLLNSLYHVAELVDVEFLVMQLARLKVRGALDYYQNILAERFNGDAYGGMIILCRGQYEQAFHYFWTLFRRNGDADPELLAAASVMLGGRPADEPLPEPGFKLSYQRIMAAYLTPETENLPRECLADYLRLLPEMIYLGDPDQLTRFLQVGKRFGSGADLSRIGDELVKQGLFQEAVALFVQQIEAASLQAVAAGLYCKAGFCCYRLQDFARAAAYFAKSLEMGYRGNDLREFLDWSEQQCADGEVKEKLRLLKKYDEKPIEVTEGQPKIMINKLLSGGDGFILL